MYRHKPNIPEKLKHVEADDNELEHLCCSSYACHPKLPESDTRHKQPLKNMTVFGTTTFVTTSLATTNQLHKVRVAITPYHTQGGNESPKQRSKARSLYKVQNVDESATLATTRLVRTIQWHKERVAITVCHTQGCSESPKQRGEA